MRTGIAYRNFLLREASKKWSQLLRLFPKLLHQLQVRPPLDVSRQLLWKDPEMIFNLFSIDANRTRIGRNGKHEADALTADIVRTKEPERYGKIILVALLTDTNNASGNSRFFVEFPKRCLLDSFSLFYPPLRKLPGIALTGLSEQQELQYAGLLCTRTKEKQ
jgi:hypothetical protein